MMLSPLILCRKKKTQEDDGNKNISGVEMETLIWVWCRKQKNILFNRWEVISETQELSQISRLVMGGMKLSEMQNQLKRSLIKTVSMQWKLSLNMKNDTLQMSASIKCDLQIITCHSLWSVFMISAFSFIQNVELVTNFGHYSHIKKKNKQINKQKA